MGYRIPVALLSLVCFPLLAGNKWNVTLPGGRLSFSGEAIVAACQVDGVEKTVDMGQVSSNRFRYAGEFASPVPFDIRLVNCSPRSAHHVSVAFRGLTDTRMPSALSVGDTPDKASGVAIALADAGGQPVEVNSPLQPVWTLQNGTLSLHFIARYVSTTAGVTGGRVDATATFLITYF
ncbi:fimbrial protein [Pantoea ananatis]|uniref:fimbrial protein n=1 Tax=Pantoea ananas TaxID=553 RepID=UPI000FEC8F52|nr:fimbrial protein [Pantoea ananatis]QAB29126.1 type 1 fimbrial protein [Pantoea ananatis]